MIESPCIGVCTLIDGKCVGCYRSQKEIREWLYFTDKERKKITETCIKKMEGKIKK